MIRVAVCDDDPQELKKTWDFCRSFARNHKENDIHIDHFSCAEELLDHIGKREMFDIMLLDIYMPGMSGIELAHHIRGIRKECRLIFLTSSREHAIEAFSLNAVHYLVKPLSSESLEEALIKAIASLEKDRNSCIVLKTCEGMQKITLADIVFCETEKHIQRVHLTGNRVLPVRISCGDLYELLCRDARFYKCGSTYIMNLGMICEVSAKQILFENGCRLPMQRRQYKELLDRFTRYSIEAF